MRESCDSEALTEKEKTGAGDKIRTYDRLITNQLLYQLSYASNQDKDYT